MRHRYGGIDECRKAHERGGRKKNDRAKGSHIDSRLFGFARDQRIFPTFQARYPANAFNHAFERRTIHTAQTHSAAETTVSRMKNGLVVAMMIEGFDASNRKKTIIGNKTYILKRKPAVRPSLSFQ